MMQQNPFNMFGGMFPGMNVGNMTFNLNLGAAAGNPMAQQGFFANPQISQGLDPSMALSYNDRANVLALDYDTSIEDNTSKVEVIESHGSDKFRFENVYIDSEYTIRVKSTRSINKPSGKYVPLNEFYKVFETLDGATKGNVDIHGKIVNRNGELPTVLYVADFADIPGNCIDDMLIHAMSLSMKAGFNYFFFIIEETGSVVFGEPERSLCFNDKGLFRKTIYQIYIPKH